MKAQGLQQSIEVSSWSVYHVILEQQHVHVHCVIYILYMYTFLFVKFHGSLHVYITLSHLKRTSISLWNRWMRENLWTREELPYSSSKSSNRFSKRPSRFAQDCWASASGKRQSAANPTTSLKSSGEHSLEKISNSSPSTCTIDSVLEKLIS